MNQLHEWKNPNGGVPQEAIRNSFTQVFVVGSMLSCRVVHEKPSVDSTRFCLALIVLVPSICPEGQLEARVLPI